MPVVYLEVNNTYHGKFIAAEVKRNDTEIHDNFPVSLNR